MVVKYLREENKVPNLTRLRLWTAGDRGTYKGFQNFGRMAYWPLDPKSTGHVGFVPDVVSFCSLWKLRW
jgi:hypothetical protein